MLKRILSNDFPRSRVLTVLLLVLLVGLALTPLLFPGAKARPTRIATRTTASQRLRGRSSESSARSIGYLLATG